MRCTRGSPQERAADTEVLTLRNLASDLHWLPEKRKKRDVETEEANFQPIRCVQSETTPHFFTFPEKAVLGWKKGSTSIPYTSGYWTRDHWCQRPKGRIIFVPNEVLMKRADLSLGYFGAIFCWWTNWTDFGSLSINFFFYHIHAEYTAYYWISKLPYYIKGTTIQMFGVLKIWFNVFESVLCSQKLHFFDRKYRKKCNIVKLLTILLYF